MKRFLPIGIALLILAFNLSAQAKPSTQSNEQPPKTEAQSPVSVTTINNQGPDQNAQGAQDDSLRWYTSPEWWLVILAVPTLIFLWYEAVQTANAAKATQDAAEATKKNVELQRVAMEQWIDTDFWEADPVHILANATEADLPIGFELGNQTKFPLTLRSVMVWIDRRHVATNVYGNLLMSPDDEVAVNISRKLEGVRLALYRTGNLGFEIGVSIRYINAFKENREQLVGFSCICGMGRESKFDQIAFTPPSEEEEKAQKQRQNPN